MKKKKYIIFLIVFIAMLGGGVTAYNYLSGRISISGTVNGQSQPHKETAPHITVTDFDGNKVKLSDFKGKPVVINFWTTWCGPCRSELAAFDMLYKEYGEKINFMMIDLTDGSRDTPETVKAYVSDNGYSFPVFFDTQADAAKTYNVFSIPHTVLIGSKGKIETTNIGAISEETLRSSIEKMIEGDKK